jgi:hypothetical protein
MNQGAGEGVRTASAPTTTAATRYEASAGGTNECGGDEHVQGCTNEHKASTGITGGSEGVQTSSRDGMNEREQVRGERAGGTNKRGGTNKCGGYERAWEGTNTAGAVAGATRPTSPSPPPPLPPFFFFFFII